MRKKVENIWMIQTGLEMLPAEVLAEACNPTPAMRVNPFQEYPWQIEQGWEIWMQIEHTMNLDPAVKASFEAMWDREAAERVDAQLEGYARGGR